MAERHLLFSMANFRLGSPRRLSLLAIAGWLAFAAAAHATVYSREQDAPDLRLGQRPRIDDGSCPAGQIKEVAGTKLTETGISRTRKCVPRGGPKLK
jgi:hypothetical protein